MKAKQHYLSVMLVTVLVIISNYSFAQPDIEWQRSYGGSNQDEGNHIIQTNDGGYIVGGFSRSNDGDVSENHGGQDYWIIKLNQIGEIQWQKNYGGSSQDVATSIDQTNDGGYIISGYSSSNNGDVSDNYGWIDYWIVKLDDIGNIQWQKNYGGSSQDVALNIQQTSDEGYIMVGHSRSNDGDVSGNHGEEDYWIVKLNQIGEIQWQKNYGGSGIDRAWLIQQTSDGGYVVAGSSSSIDGDITNNQGGSDGWIVKLNANGNILWQKSIGATGSDLLIDIKQTNDGGYITAGNSNSNTGSSDAWILKLNSDGIIQWEKKYGGSDYDGFYSINPTLDGGYIAVGTTKSTDGDITHNNGDYDYWVVKVDNSGNIQWQKSLGGSTEDLGRFVHQTNDGGFIITGYSWSNDGDVTENKGISDYWIVKLYPDTASIEEHDVLGINIYPNPAKNTLRIDTQNQTIDKINIYSISGALIQEYKMNTVSPTIDVSSLATGMYFVQLHSGKEIALKKFVKE